MRSNLVTAGKTFRNMDTIKNEASYVTPLQKMATKGQPTFVIKRQCVIR